MSLMNSSEMLTLFLCGDVMLGRGIDQVLPYPSNPVLYEDHLKNALQYVKLAEDKNGAIPKPVPFDYVWGDSLRILEQFNPAVRIINLETSITTSNDWEDKGINYRMHPHNCAVLSIPKIDICALANNHILDWGREGLKETIATLHGSGFKTSGAGWNLYEASTPAIVTIADQRILFFSMATPSSGVPNHWGADNEKSGVMLLPNLSVETIRRVINHIYQWRKNKDIIIVSIHWGGNWGYEITNDQTAFARSLIAKGDVHIIHGHSSHHVKAIEIFQNRLILYGCGDFINDYEGIKDHEIYHGDFPVMFFPSLDLNTGNLTDLRLFQLHLKKFHLEKAPSQSIQWLKNILNRESNRFGVSFDCLKDDSLRANWAKI
ncbi:MAG: CapA family protein [Bdellovibrio sp.]